MYHEYMDKEGHVTHKHYSGRRPGASLNLEDLEPVEHKPATDEPHAELAVYLKSRKISLTVNGKTRLSEVPAADHAELFVYFVYEGQRADSGMDPNYNLFKIAGENVCRVEELLK